METFPHRSDVPSRLWDDLIQRASSRIDVLVHAGQFLHERPGFIATVKAKAETGVEGLRSARPRARPPSDGALRRGSALACSGRG